MVTIRGDDDWSRLAVVPIGRGSIPRTDPVMGEHSRAVLTRGLRLNNREVDDLIAAEVIEQWPEELPVTGR